MHQVLSQELECPAIPQAMVATFRKDSNLPPNDSDQENMRNAIIRYGFNQRYPRTWDYGYLIANRLEYRAKVVAAEAAGDQWNLTWLSNIYPPAQALDPLVERGDVERQQPNIVRRRTVCFLTEQGSDIRSKLAVQSVGIPAVQLPSEVYVLLQLTEHRCFQISELLAEVSNILKVTPHEGARVFSKLQEEGLIQKEKRKVGLEHRPAYRLTAQGKSYRRGLQKAASSSTTLSRES
jgi:DNA-binding MarR family transcriptional regulator